ncbi:MAG: hypothetical protein VW274_04270, partial [Thalassolituus sp.]
AINCAPQNAMNYYNLGILNDLYRNDLVEALSWYRKARRLLPDDEKLNIWIVDLARRAGQPEEDPEEINVWQAELEALIRQREAEAAAARAAKLAAEQASNGILQQEAVSAEEQSAESGIISDTDVSDDEDVVDLETESAVSGDSPVTDEAGEVSE